MSNQLQFIAKQLDECLLCDRYRFTKKLQRIQSDKNRRQAEQQLLDLVAQVERSCQRAQQRKDGVPRIDYSEDLPIAQKREDIAKAIFERQVVVVAGETGSGKTTQIPKICLELGRGTYGMIGHTQPRRLAARTVATRIAEELRVSLGQQVGYQVRFTDQVGENSLIKLMTDGILLAETQQDRYLSRYDTLIIDEAHERSLNIDFLLGYLKRLLPKRPDLKVIITSATIDVERFAAHFEGAPIIEVSGRTYPVTVQYQSPEKEEVAAGDPLLGGIINAVETIRSQPRRTGANDILVFLSGEREIRDVAHALKKQSYRHTEILPLYARLSNAEQNRVFQPHSGQRIVLATNVAETSITVPGIGYVIDPGLARISRYSARSKVQRLPVEPISQASANQRMGRCGRVAEGLCIRLYEEEDFNNRPEFTDAEILRTNLGSVILQMLNLKLGEIDRFPFLDPPDRRAIKDGFELLRELGAVNQKQQITQVGRQVARFPIDPRVGRMVLAASQNGSLREVLIIASALTIQDPRERPMDKQQVADEKHRAYQDEDSDFVSLLNLWNVVEEQRQELSQNQFRKYCRTQFLSYLRIREWRDVHRQLLLVCKDMGYKLNQQAAEYTEIHVALLAGLLSHIGDKEENKEFKGARNHRFHIFPGSNLFKKPPKWVMAAELVETSKLYARMNAKIDPGWIEPAAKHLVKKSHFEPHWEKKRGQVTAFEQVTLYGLVIVAKRKVDFSKIDLVQSREIFIRSALVEGEIRTGAAFYQANIKLLEEVAALEDKSRRRDILVDEQVVFDFYNERLPEKICSKADLENWARKSSKAEQKAMLLSREYLMQHAANEITEQQFPDYLLIDNRPFDLSYQFLPGNEEDGVTLTVPLAMLGQIPANRLEWLVPGMLRDKCIALVKGLPKIQRKNFVPVPDFVDRAMRDMKRGEQSLVENLAHAIQRVSGHVVQPDAWDAKGLDDHYRMRICVIDEAGLEIGQGRDIYALRQRFKQQVQDSLNSLDKPEYERSGIVKWDFGEIAQEVEISQAGIKLKAYSAIIDEGDNVALKLVDTKTKAFNLSRHGILRLFMLETATQVKYLRKNLPGFKQMSLYYATLGRSESLMDDLLKAIYERVFLTDQELPLTADDFTERLESGRGDLVQVANEVANHLLEILQLYHRLMKKLKGNMPAAWLFVYTEIKSQLGRLVFDGFISQVSWHRLQHYSRYLHAVEQRMEKIQNQLGREKQWCVEFTKHWHGLEMLMEKAQLTDACRGEIEELRWLFEEYRVSVYAQKLGTTEPVSGKRIENRIEKLRMAF